MFNVGPTELLVILVLALMVFGPKRLPETSRQIGRGLREFRRATQDVQNELHGVMSLDDIDADDADEPASSNGSGPAKAEAGTPETPGSVESAAEPSATEPSADGPSLGDEARTQSPAPETDASANGKGASQGHTVIDPTGD